MTTTTTKNGDIKRTYKAVDSEKDWIAIKTKTEQIIDNSNKTVGKFIYDTLLSNPQQKIRGKLVRTIERKFYRSELNAILDTQCKLHPELKSIELYQDCIHELYPRNEAHINNIKNRDFKYLFLDDIIFYQRPLKSKKSTISKCPYESRSYLKSVSVKENGVLLEKKVEVKEGINTIPKSHPLYQEFRLWQFLNNLKFYRKETRNEVDVTKDFLGDEKAKVDLFDFLNTRKEIDQKSIFEYFIKKETISKEYIKEYRWNFVEDKKYPANETKSAFLSRLKNVTNLDENTFLTDKVETHLWQIVYSVKDKREYEKALNTFADKYDIDSESFVESFKKFPPFSNEYGAYSQKALLKILPLMRMGKYWDIKEVPTRVIERSRFVYARVEAYNNEYDKYEKKSSFENVADDDIPKQIIKSFSKFENEIPLKGLNTYQACYLIYNRHSEIGDVQRWETPQHIDQYLNDFKQHSLRNPIVEQVVTETLRTVRDIWQYYGEGATKFFDEIHLELGREMKNPADKRKQISSRNSENENTNQRIRELLTEMMNDDSIEGDVRPYSPSHQEILKIYEEGVYQNPSALYEDFSFEEVDKIRKNGSPSRAEIIKYKLWLSQGYCSPYTGEIIPLSRLFTEDYQIEHIIPQSRFFDDSLSNKIICESVVNANPYKDNQTGYEFIKNNGGRIVSELSTGERTVKIFSVEEYEHHCNKYFKNNRGKLNRLMSEDIPEGFIQRQMNDSRYISKLVKSLLSNIVRQEGELEATAKNLIPITGSITSKMKQDWGLNDKWNEIVAPRFQRLNNLTNSKDFGYWDEKIRAFRCEVPAELKKGFSKKRIDHRHHALDALIIACVTKDHINYITSLNTLRKNHSLVAKLRNLEDRQIVDRKTGEVKIRKVAKNYHLPWNSFPKDALNSLLHTIISFKHNIRVINKTNNKTWQWVEKNGQFKKALIKQTKGDNWAIRKPLHKETVSGAVRIRVKKTVSFANGVKDWKNLVDKELKIVIRNLVEKGVDEKGVSKYFKENPYELNGKPVDKLEVYTFSTGATATRIALNEKFSRKQLESVTDSGIQTILENHLKYFIDEKGKERFDLAFSQEGLEELNKNIVRLNNGKKHHPIYKVRVYEVGSKFNVGTKGNKSSKYVEAAKGTNLFFGIYEGENKKGDLIRQYDTIPLNIVIERQKQGLSSVPEVYYDKDNNIYQLLFSLSPNDLVYVPTNVELENMNAIDFGNLDLEQSKRIYKMEKSSGKECYFIPHFVANLIKQYDAKSKFGEFGSQNKLQMTIENTKIVDKCIKMEVDRIGNILDTDKE